MDFSLNKRDKIFVVICSVMDTTIKNSQNTWQALNCIATLYLSSYELFFKILKISEN
jgi:hypothetical protein